MKRIALIISFALCANNIHADSLDYNINQYQEAVKRIENGENLDYLVYNSSLCYSKFALQSLLLKAKEQQVLLKKQRNNVVAPFLGMVKGALAVIGGISSSVIGVIAAHNEEKTRELITNLFTQCSVGTKDGLLAISTIGLLFGGVGIISYGISTLEKAAAFLQKTKKKLQQNKETQQLILKALARLDNTRINAYGC